ncbi:Dabb family protein [Natronogracilivirga saccharolytica]|uniref:Dabb family protein n=1 Tax=Natronogracilivirga saccharolytica TaxID=2812953 RepID=A0A8J7RRJ4_9BACT|nr:Dabb family protein [Natronogracilivirga saccharolytica]MBP3191652.1 Dabb family protein [Natronogracilivirga saccharolytica]
MILHSVFFYLKKDAPENTAEEMQKDIKEKLSKIDSVKTIWAGPPEGIDRDVVDNDYTMSLHAQFEDLAALQRYQSDPLHVAFVEKYKPAFQEIRVFDTRIS